MSEKLTFSYKSEGYDPDAYDLVPAGTYTAKIDKVDYRENKAKTGHYLNIQFKILGPKQAGRVVFAMLNIDHPNEIAVDIAKKDLDAIVHFCDMPHGFNSQDDLLEKVLDIDVDIEQQTGYEARNVVKKYNKASALPTTNQAPPAEEQCAPTKKPWEK